MEELLEEGHPDHLEETDLKKLLRIFAYRARWCIFIWSLFSRGDIDISLFDFINDFRVDHQSLEEIEFEVSFTALLS